MYRWYQEAAVCFGYLSDVRAEDIKSGLLRDWNCSFARSRWFTRGWTLQELIAPAVVVFYDQLWQRIGTKATLKQEISSHTGIPISVLSNGDLEDFSVAQKMSWGARRETSRVEDRAYSLLGIFGVNMPLLYGEGQRAFIRLQEEVLKITNDYSILAWQTTESGDSGPLALSPNAFYHSYHVVSIDQSNKSEPIVFDNQGIHLEAVILGGCGSTTAHFAVLPCRILGLDARPAIQLEYLPDSEDCFRRLNPYRFEIIYTSQFHGLSAKQICIQRARRSRSQKHSQSLARAVVLGNERLVRVLLEDGANPENSEYNGHLPLAKASSDGRIDLVQLLLQYGATIYQLPPRGATALSLAVKNRHVAVARMLLENGPDIFQEEPDLIVAAAQIGDEEMVKLLLEYGANVHHCDALSRKPLMEALIHNHKSIARLLEEAGAVLTHEDNFQLETRLLTSAKEGNAVQVRMLLEMGAKIETRDVSKDGYNGPAFDRTPLGWAARCGHRNVVELLLEKGADVETRDGAGRTPLMWAARESYRRGEDMVQLLLDNGSSLENTDNDGRTALSLACTLGVSEAAIRTLIAKGADVNARDSEGGTPLSLARKNRLDSIAELLESKGATVDDENGPYSAGLFAYHSHHL